MLRESAKVHELIWSELLKEKGFYSGLYMGLRTPNSKP